MNGYAPVALYRSAELGQVMKLPDKEPEAYVPPVART